MVEFDRLLSEARPAEQIVSVCLRGDLLAEHQRLSRLLSDERNRARISIDDAGPVDVAAQIQDVERRMREATWDFRVCALPRRRLRELSASVDEGEPLSLAILRESLVDPQVTDEQWLRLVGDDNTDGVLPMGELQRLVHAANEVNFQETSVPTSRLASVFLHRSDGS
jgi:hypothetical protein